MLQNSDSQMLISFQKKKQILIHKVWVGAFLASSRVMLLLLVQGPHKTARLREGYDQFSALGFE